MRRLSLSIAATLLLLAAPLSTAAQQYATPEEILLSGKRGAQQAVKEDTERRLNLHPSTLSEPGTGPAAGALQAAPSSEEEPDLHAAPSEEPGTLDGELPLDPVTLRYLRRLQNLRQLQYQEILQSSSLHQGASLSDTGPAAIVALLAVLGAVGVTLWRARHRKMLYL